MRGFFAIRTVKGFDAIRNALDADSNLDAMNQIGRMKLAGYDVKTDSNGVWQIPKSEIKRFLKGRPPKAGGS